MIFAVFIFMYLTK